MTKKIIFDPKASRVEKRKKESGRRALLKYPYLGGITNLFLLEGL